MTSEVLQSKYVGPIPHAQTTVVMNEGRRLNDIKAFEQSITHPSTSPNEFQEIESSASTDWLRK